MAEFKKVPSKYGVYVTYHCPKSGCTWETPYLLSRYTALDPSAQKYIDLHKKDSHGKK